MARGALDVEIVGLSNLAKIPAELERRRRKLQAEVAGGMAEEIGKTIRSRSGRLARSWKGSVRRDGLAVVKTTGVVYGKASVRGAFITPKKRRALRFKGRGGEIVFRTFVRLNPGAYVGKPRDRRTSYVSVAFARGFRGVLADRFRRVMGSDLA